MVGRGLCLRVWGWWVGGAAFGARVPPLEAMLAHLVGGWWVAVGRPQFVRFWLRAVL